MTKTRKKGVAKPAKGKGKATKKSGKKAADPPPPPPKRKVGFVVECNIDGAEHTVLAYLVKKLRDDIEPVFNFAVNKGNLFRELNARVEALFDVSLCERVFVIWDLMPSDAPFQEEGRPCRKREREHLRDSLRAKDKDRTVLLCITHELEAWLIADGSALTATLTRLRPAHPADRITDVRRPEQERDPKDYLERAFRNAKRRDYQAWVHAHLIIKEVTDLGKITNACPSFARFTDKLLAV